MVNVKSLREVHVLLLLIAILHIATMGSAVQLAHAVQKIVIVIPLVLQEISVILILIIVRLAAELIFHAGFRLKSVQGVTGVTVREIV
jgi:hypothetical protein